MDSSSSKIKIISGRDAYFKEDMYQYEQLSNISHETKKNNPRLLTRVIFGKKKIIQNNNDTDNINESIKNLSQNPIAIINFQKRQEIASHEKSLFVSKTFADNQNSPWELVQFDPDNYFDNFDDISNNPIEDPIDNILQKIYDSDDTISMSEPNDLLKCYHVNKNLRSCFSFDLLSIKDYEKKSSTGDDESILTKRLKVDYALYQNIEELRSIIQILISNSIIEKVIKKINSDIKLLDGFNVEPKSQSELSSIPKQNMNTSTFWMSSVYDDLTKTLSFITDKKNIRNILPINCKHKNFMVTNIMKIIECFEKTQSEHVLKLFNHNDSFNSFIDQYGITKYLIHHPFLLYCVVNDKIQLYKFFISNISSNEIRYELFQIHELYPQNSIIESSPTEIGFTRRPKIISRNIIEKFKFINKNDPINKYNKDKQVMFEINKLNLKIEKTEIEELNNTIFQKINTYVSNWSSLINIIIKDATKCIRAFITNSKKRKIDFDINIVDHNLCEKILNEIQILDLIDDKLVKLSVESDINIIDPVEHVFNKICKIVPEFVLNHGDYSKYRYISSKIYTDFHPMKHLIKLLHNRELINIDTKHFESNRNIRMTFIERYSNDSLLKNFVEDNHVMYQHKMSYIVLRDLVYINDSIDLFHNINNIHIPQTHSKFEFNESIIINLKINSNCHLKIYTRIENNCLLLAEGKNINIPIIPNYVLRYIFIKVDDPDKIINEIKKSISPPFVKLTYSILNSPANFNFTRDGFMIDFMSDIENIENNENNQKATKIVNTFLYVNKEINIKNCHTKRIFFGIIQNETHLTKIEKLIY